MAGRFSVDATFRAIDRFTRPMQRMERRSRRFARSLQTGMRGVQRFASGAVAGLRQVGLYAGIAGTAIGALAAHVVKTGSGFEEAMSGVGAVMLKTSGEIGALHDKAIELGKTTKFTGAQVAEGMELMARAGFKEKDILEGIGGVLSAAAASGMDLAETSGHVSNVLKGMGLETSRAAEVADVLALASSRTNSTIGSLGESMRNVASTARQLKIPLKDTVAAVALLQDVGLDASVAGSSLNTMLTKLSKPTAALRSQMKKMGVEFEDANGNMLPLVDVMSNMATAAEKSGGNMKQMAFFADLVGLRGQKAAANLKDLFVSGKFKELTAELENSAGAAKKMADLKLDNLRGDFTKLTSAVDAFESKLFEASGGGLRGIVQGMTEWLSANEAIAASDIADVVEQLKTLAGIFTDAFLDNLSGMAKSFGLFGGSGKEALRNIDTPVWRDFAKDLGTIAAALVVTVVVVGKLGKAILSVAGLIVGGLKAAFGAILKDIGGLIANFTGLIDSIAAIFDNKKTTMAEKMVQLAKAVVKGFVRGIALTAKLIWDTATGFGHNFLKGVKKAFDSRSPSRKMTAEALNVGKGWVQGLDKMVGESDKAMQRLVKLPERGHLRMVYSAKQDPERDGEGRAPLADRERPALTSVSAAQMARSVEESITTRNAVVRLRTDPGTSANVEKQPEGSGVTLKLEPTGTF